MELSAIYVALTEGLLQKLSLSHEAAHLWGGLFLYAVVFSLPLARRYAALPFAAVCAAQLFNEGLQAIHYSALRADDTLADFIWTLTLPALTYSATAVSRGLRLPERAQTAFANT